MKRLARPRRPLIGLLSLALLATPLVVGSSAAAGAPPAPALIPKPVSQRALQGQTFTLQSWSTVGVVTNSKERLAAHRVADQLTAQLRRSTGYPLPVKSGPGAITTLHERTELARRGGLPATRGPLGVARHRAHARRSVPRRHHAAPATARQGRRRNAVRPVPGSVAGTTITDSPPVRVPRAPCSTCPGTSSPWPRSSATSTSSRSTRSTSCTCTCPTTRAGGSKSTRGRDSRRTAAASRSAARPVGYYTKADFAEIVRYAAEHYLRSSPRSTPPGTPTRRWRRTPS